MSDQSMSDNAHTRLRHPEFRGQIGISRTVITPPLGIYARTWGSATHDIAEGVHRPLLGSCLVFQDSGCSIELVLVTLDIMVFWQEEADKIRTAIPEQLGLEPQQLILHPSHTHSTPFLLNRQADKPGGHLILPYLASIPTLCCDCLL